MKTVTRMNGAERERRRVLAVRYVEAGHEQREAAETFGVAESTISGWMKRYRRDGWSGLASRPRSGRPPKLSSHQAREVLSWFARPATDFGFANQLWTAPRVATLIQRTWRIRFHPRYVNQWLAERRVTPQKLVRRPRERNDEQIAQWRRREWPRLKNAPSSAVRTSF